MSAATAPDVRDYDIPEKRDESGLPTFAFKISGEPYTLIRPKVSIAANLIALVEQRADLETSSVGLSLASLCWSFVDYIAEDEPEPAKIEDPEHDPASTAKPKMIANPNAGRLRGRSRLRQRLHSPTDALDVTDLLPIFVDAASVMFQRPTQALRESSSKRSATGRGSSGRSRAARAGTSKR